MATSKTPALRVYVCAVSVGRNQPPSSLLSSTSLSTLIPPPPLSRGNTRTLATVLPWTQSEQRAAPRNSIIHKEEKTNKQTTGKEHMLLLLLLMMMMMITITITTKQVCIPTWSCSWWVKMPSSSPSSAHQKISLQ